MIKVVSYLIVLGLLRLVFFKNILSPSGKTVGKLSKNIKLFLIFLQCTLACLKIDSEHAFVAFHLVNLDKNDSGTVNLSVTLDGESQGNIYQDTLAKLKMNFAVEKEETPGKSSEPDTDKTHRVKTGDIWMGSSVIMLIIGIALVVAAFFFMRKEGRVNEKNK